MKRFSLGLVLLLGLVPLSACNQNNNRAPGAHERRERGIFGERHERGILGARHGRGMFGERGGRRGRLREACADDIAKYCSSEDRPRLKRECLRDHLDQLSADCKTFIENREGRRRRRDF